VTGVPGLKLVFLVPDGVADLPLEELGGKTPLQAARSPSCDEIARRGSLGLVRTVPDGMQPGSDVANLSLLGYDPARCYGGRGPIEAANMGIEVPEGWTAFRCNLVNVKDGTMVDYSAGHISREAAAGAIGALEEGLADDGCRFFQGKSYRNILLVEGDYEGLECTPPHDITGKPVGPYMPRGGGAGRIIRLMERSEPILAGLEVNRRLSQEGGRPATMIWPWGQGRAMVLEPFREKFGLSGGVISAVDLICGLGKLAGLRAVPVEGMTGFLDTNYRGKGEAAIELLGEDDFVYLHVEATDEASHMGDVEAKIAAMERFDSLVAGPLLEHMLSREDRWRLVVCPDHPTFISTGTHDSSPVPLAACGEGIGRDTATAFSEEQAASSGHLAEEGWMMMAFLSGKKPWPWR
jgi:2,3-bisphosphoglycerate-independent phosphoglycerate mutase